MLSNWPGIIGAACRMTTRSGRRWATGKKYRGCHGGSQKHTRSDSSLLVAPFLVIILFKSIVLIVLYLKKDRFSSFTLFVRQEANTHKQQRCVCQCGLHGSWWWPWQSRCFWWNRSPWVEWIHMWNSLPWVRRAMFLPVLNTARNVWKNQESAVTMEPNTPSRKSHDKQRMIPRVRRNCYKKRKVECGRLEKSLGGRRKIPRCASCSLVQKSWGGMHKIKARYLAYLYGKNHLSLLLTNASIQFDSIQRMYLITYDLICVILVLNFLVCVFVWTPAIPVI